MKNITVSVDDETYRRARITAAERNTSVSALVRDYLQDISAATEVRDDATTALFAALDRALEVQATSRLSRDEAHAR